MHHLEYFSESSLSNDSHHFEVLELGIFLLGILVHLSEAHLGCSTTSTTSTTGTTSETFLDFIIFIWIFFLRVLLQILGLDLLLLSHGECLVVAHLLWGLFLRFLGLLFTDIFLTISKLKWGKFVVAALSVFLGGGETFKILLLNIKDAQILLMDIIVFDLKNTNDGVPPTKI
jgi:hypothetical protein